MAKQKHNPKSRHHKRIVGGILATALALMVVVAAQIGNTDTGLFKAQTGGTMTEAEMQAGCVASGGTWMGISAMPPCQMPTSGGTASTSCPSGQYWSGTACVNNTTTTTTSCPSGQYWSGTACVNNTTTTTTSCPSGQYWNGTACVNNANTSTTCSGGQYWNGTACVNSTTGAACPSGQWWDSYTNSCKSSTATGGTANYCPAGQWWDYSTNTCKSSTATGGTANYCPAGQWWDYSTNTCKSSTTSGTAATTCGSGMWWDDYTHTCKSSTATGGTAYPAGTCSNGTAYPAGYGYPPCGTSTTPQVGPSKKIVWNNLGVESYVCDNAPQAEIDARKLIVKDVSMNQINWPNATDCNRTDKRAGFPEKGTSTSTNTYTQPVQTVDNCKNNGGTWNAGSSTCTYGTYNGMTDGASQYVTSATCTAAGYFWGPKSNWCFNTKLEFDKGENMTGGYTDSNPSQSCANAGGSWVADAASSNYNSGWCDMSNATSTQWKNPASFGGDPEGCKNAGFYYNDQMQDCFPSGGMMSPGSMNTAWNDCGPNSYFDFGKHACMPMQEPVWDSFQYDATACYPGDPMCGQFNQGNFVDGQFDTQSFFDLDRVQCMNPRDAKRTLGMRKKELKDFDRELKSMDLSTLSQSPTIAAAVSSIEDAKSIAQEMEANPSSADYGCLAGKLDRIVGQLHSPEVGFWDAINSLRQTAEFKAQLENIRWEFDELDQRLSYMNIDEEDAAKVTAIKEAGLAKIDELSANPPVDDWGNVDWDSMEPECMKFGGPMPMGPGGFGGGPGFGDDFGGGFGGPMPGPFRPCSYDEALESDTPRGYIEAARILLDELQQSQFQDNMCEEAASHIDEFKQMVEANSDQLDERDADEAERWFADADKALALCESSEDKFQIMPAFERLKMRAERLAERLGFGDEFNQGSRRFDGSQLLMSQNVLNDIDSLEEFINQRIKDTVNKIVYEKLQTITSTILGSLARAGLPDEVLSGLTSALNTLVADEANEDIIEGVTNTVEIASALTASSDAENVQAVNDQQEALVKNLNSLNTLGSIVSEEVQDAVQKVGEAVAERPYTPERLEQSQEALDDAINLAKNGADPEEVEAKLEDAKEALVASEDSAENDKILNRELVDRRLLEHTDINPRAWYGPSATEAGVLCDLGTVTDDGTKVARPAVGLNVAEGWTTAAKCSGIEPNSSNVTPEVKAIIGNVTWAGEYFQGMVDAGVPVAVLREKVRSEGGIAGSMERGEAVDSLITIMKARGVDFPEIDPETEIGHYEDYDRLSEAQREDLARAHYYGVSTGAAGGTRADANAPIDRAQMFTMAVRDYHALEAEGVLFPTPPTARKGEGSSTSRNLPDTTGGRVEDDARVGE